MILVMRININKSDQQLENYKKCLEVQKGSYDCKKECRGIVERHRHIMFLNLRKKMKL